LLMPSVMGKQWVSNAIKEEIMAVYLTAYFR